MQNPILVARRRFCQGATVCFCLGQRASRNSLHHLQPRILFVVQPVHCVAVRPRYDVPVNINRRLDGSVTELVFDVVQRFTCRQQQAGKGVADVVDADLGYVRLLQYLPKRPTSEIVHIHRDSPGTGKHQVDFACVALDRW